MLGVLDDITALMNERGVTQPLRFAATLADGERFYAFRIATDGKPPTMYLRRCSSGVIVASEPLAEDEPGWHMLPDGAVATVDRSGCSVQASRFEPALFS